VSAFNDCRAVEQRSFDILKPYFAEATDDGRYVLTDKGRLAADLQQKYGDVVAQKNGDVVCIEVKAEESNHWGNFFLEEWSNRSRFNPGWLLKLDTDYLFYHFIESDELYILDFPKLQYWAFIEPGILTGFPGRLYDFPSKPQTKRVQRNDTWGRCVPIFQVLDGVSHKVVNPRTGGSAVPPPPPPVATQCSMFDSEVL